MKTIVESEATFENDSDIVVEVALMNRTWLQFDRNLVAISLLNWTTRPTTINSHRATQPNWTATVTSSVPDIRKNLRWRLAVSVVRRRLNAHRSDVQRNSTEPDNSVQLRSDDVLRRGIKIAHRCRSVAVQLSAVQLLAAHHDMLTARMDGKV